MSVAQALTNHDTNECDELCSMVRRHGGVLIAFRARHTSSRSCLDGLELPGWESTIPFQFAVI